MTDYEELELAQTKQIVDFSIKYRELLDKHNSLCILFEKMQSNGDLVEIPLPLKGKNNG